MLHSLLTEPLSQVTETAHELGAAMVICYDITQPANELGVGRASGPNGFSHFAFHILNCFKSYVKMLLFVSQWIS